MSFELTHDSAVLDVGFGVELAAANFREGTSSLSTVKQAGVKVGSAVVKLACPLEAKRKVIESAQHKLGACWTALRRESFEELFNSLEQRHSSFEI